MNGKVWLPGMGSNHELDRFFIHSNLLILTKSLKSSKASKAGKWYKIGTIYLPKRAPCAASDHKPPAFESSPMAIRASLA